MSIIRKELDAIFAHAPDTKSPLEERLNWVSDLLHWILSDSQWRVKDAYFKTGETQALRVKWLLRVFERQPDWRKKAQVVLSSLTRETQIFDLLVMTGLQQKSGLLSEILERVLKKILPQPKSEADLQYFFGHTFDSLSDAQSFIKISPDAFSQLADLFQGEGSDLSFWRKNLLDAAHTLSLQIANLGLDVEIRRLLEVHRIHDISFYQVHENVMNWLSCLRGLDLDLKDNRLTQEYLSTSKTLNISIDQSIQQIEVIFQKMDKHGVSVSMVYLLDRIDKKLKRLSLVVDYMNLLSSQRLTDDVKSYDFVTQTQNLIATLVRESLRSRRVSTLFDENTTLIAKKIVENSAEAGEHYIARTHRDYNNLFQRAMGGGVVTAFTVVIKTIVSWLPVSPFFMGFLASVNYSISFLAIQRWGYTLATKQPAMTAAALAQKMNLNMRATEIQNLLNEVVYLLRSQVVAVFGNVIAVIPVILLMSYTYESIFKTTFLNIDKAQTVLNDFSIFGPTPIYAAFTGVLLFASSLVAGWFYNWVLFRRFHEGLAQSRRLQRLFGSEKMKNFADYFKKNCAGFAGNISLGFFLGLVPVFADFLGLPLDVRHVTLSAGMATSAVMSFGLSALESYDFWFAVFGILSMAFFNIGVSFLLALTTAFRAKKIEAPVGLSILKEIIKQILRRPGLILFPQKTY